jgi:trans-L-3-hydroxyproline dehydratase
MPHILGATMLERRRYVTDHLDSFRTALLWEPRGHREMYGAVITAPVSEGADFGILFMHNEGYSTMCGHGIIAVATAAVETGAVEVHEPKTKLIIDTPAGRVRTRVKVEGGRARAVVFRNVPSFVVALDEDVQVPEVGRIRYDLAFGGAFYAYVAAAQVGARCVEEEAPLLTQIGMAIKRAIMEKRQIQHPDQEDLGFLYGTIFVAPPLGPDAGSRNVCIFADGQVDRSPTGTGVSGRLAIHHARGEIGKEEPLVVESIIGTRFTGRVVETTSVGRYAAVFPEVEGTAHITGHSEFWIDPADPLKGGFLL